jgi:hypothetical protein
MEDKLILARDGICSFKLEIYDGHGVVVLNAVAMLNGELEKRYGLRRSAQARDEGMILIEKPSLIADNDQTFQFRTEFSGDRWSLILNASGESGILYALCEVLDQIEVNDGVVLMPVLNMTSSPTMKKRGTERHWKPSFSDDEGVEANIRLIRALARKRINTLLWIDDWISPGWYRFLEFRHYPPLHRPERRERVAKAKDCLRRIVAEARAWGMEFYIATTEFTVPESLTRIAPHLFHTNERGFPVLRFEHPETWQYYRAKIREMMEDIPGLAGIELWLGEAMDPFICHFDHPDQWPVHRQFMHVWEQTLAAMDDAKRSDATLVCPTFTHHPNGDAIMRTGLLG